MKKIIIVVEGSTEEQFVRRVICNDFILRGVYVDAQQWVTNRKLGSTGGGKSFDLIENHIRRLINHYHHDSNVFISTMIDLYAFPRQGNTVYDSDVDNCRSGKEKAILLQQKMEDRLACRKFIPYVQLYEFEALLLSKPDEFLNFYTTNQQEIQTLKAEINGMMPEEINDTPDGAPSKRIIRHIPAHKKQKTTAGVITAECIGLPHLRATCPHFNKWITALEAL